MRRNDLGVRVQRLVLEGKRVRTLNWTVVEHTQKENVTDACHLACHSCCPLFLVHNQLFCLLRSVFLQCVVLVVHI